MLVVQDLKLNNVGVFQFKIVQRFPNKYKSRRQVQMLQFFFGEAEPTLRYLNVQQFPHPSESPIFEFEETSFFYIFVLPTGLYDGPSHRADGGFASVWKHLSNRALKMQCLPIYPHIEVCCQLDLHRLDTFQHYPASISATIEMNEFI